MLRKVSGSLATLSLIFAAVLPSAFAQSDETQLFTGVATTTGTVLGQCNFAPPQASDAERDADQQAEDFCKAKGQHAVRTTGYSHSWNMCVWGGIGYQYAHDIAYAQAVYKCE